MRLLPAVGFAVLAAVSGWTGHTLGTRAAPPKRSFTFEEVERRNRAARDSFLALYRTQGDALDSHTLALVGFSLDLGLRDPRSGFGTDTVRYLVPRDTAEGRRLLRLAEERGDTLASHYLWMLHQRRFPAIAAQHNRRGARSGALWGARYAVAADVLAGRYDSLAALLAHPVAGPNVRRETERLRRTTDSVAAASGDTTARRMADALAGVLAR